MPRDLDKDNKDKGDNNNKDNNKVERGPGANKSLAGVDLNVVDSSKEVAGETDSRMETGTGMLNKKLKKEK